MRTEGDVSIVELTGRLNLGTNLTFLEIDLKKAIDSGVRKMAMDLSALEYIDSAGIGMLMLVYGEMNRAGGHMAIAGATGVVMRAFDIVHLSRVIPLHNTVPEAVSSLQSS